MSIFCRFNIIESNSCDGIVESPTLDCLHCMIKFKPTIPLQQFELFVRCGLLIQIYQSFYRNEKCQFSVRSVLGTLQILHKQLANELNDYVLL